MYTTLAIILIALKFLVCAPEVGCQLLSEQKTEGWSQLDLTTSSKGLANHNSDVSSYLQSDSSTSSTPRSSATNVAGDNELPMGFLGADSQQLFPFDFNAMKHYAEPLFNVLNQTFNQESNGGLYQTSNGIGDQANGIQLDNTDQRNLLRLNMPSHIQLDNFKKRALKSLPQINLKSVSNEPGGSGANTWPFEAAKKIKYHSPLNPFEQLIAANMMAAGNPLLKSLLAKQKRAIEPDFLMSPSNQVTRVLTNNYNLPTMSNPMNLYNNDLEQPRPLASMKREFPTFFIESPTSNKASRFAEEEALGAYMDQMYTSTKMSSPFYASYPYSHMGLKYYPASRKVFDKSLITSALVGIGAGIISFLIISNIFLSLPLFALSLLHLFGANNMIINPNNNIQPNNNNQQTTTTRPPNQGRKRRSSNHLDELEQKLLGVMNSFSAKS